MEGHWKFLGGGGVLKAKFLEAMYENKPEFPEGQAGGGGRWGAKQKTFSGGSMDTFSGSAQWVGLNNKNSPKQLTLTVHGLIFGRAYYQKEFCI